MTPATKSELDRLARIAAYSEEARRLPDKRSVRGVYKKRKQANEADPNLYHVILTKRDGLFWDATLLLDGEALPRIHEGRKTREQVTTTPLSRAEADELCWTLTRRYANYTYTAPKKFPQIIEAGGVVSTVRQFAVKFA